MQIHQPQEDLFLSSDYPAPILDLKESRLRAIQAFKDSREASNIWVIFFKINIGDN